MIIHSLTKKQQIKHPCWYLVIYILKDSLFQILTKSSIAVFPGLGHIDTHLVPLTLISTVFSLTIYITFWKLYCSIWKDLILKKTHGKDFFPLPAHSTEHSAKSTGCISCELHTHRYIYTQCIGFFCWTKWCGRRDTWPSQSSLHLLLQEETQRYVNVWFHVVFYVRGLWKTSICISVGFFPPSGLQGPQVQNKRQISWDQCHHPTSEQSPVTLQLLGLMFLYSTHTQHGWRRRRTLLLTAAFWLNQHKHTDEGNPSRCFM